MSITLPNASTANTGSTATIAVDVATAEAEFIAATTVLINQAISNGLFEVEPLLPLLVTPTYVSNYFTNLGYKVVFPILPPCPYWPPLYIPEVVPPGYIPPNTPKQIGLPRIQISWTTP